MIHPVHPEYGERHECYKCGCKFYDLGRPDKVCPKCVADQVEAPSPEERLFASRIREVRFTEEPLPEVESDDSDDDDSDAADSASDADFDDDDAD
ncbi:MAG: FYDLN acid domain-containing protein [Candidatus Alcyoniella australis]|nr:FYDLN acid domain-containing protein [Candidatus Alcyoniella australis]